MPRLPKSSPKKKQVDVLTNESENEVIDDLETRSK